ncbi:hypothetical protein [Sphingomonas sp. PAMC 26605]|uniref:hypothetical protein n=1 Tax=Sphingomonas sp. PAMC 26605 TaxID=1112214 RepID=UPI00026CC5FC|nr:hypothetical protein [Sphingomonas sp. PAMC 26605]
MTPRADKAKRKGRVGGAAMMIGMFFATLFDPKKAAAVVQIDTQRRIGSEAERIAAAASAPPADPRQVRD